MGEYARFNGEEIKIGTCENMYYLRADQRHLVTAIAGNVDPSVANPIGIRFRFPFPSEDHVAPGEFDRPFHGSRVDVPIPADVDHGKVQFRADNGYLLLTPCPESHDHGLDVGLNGYGGPQRIVQQRWDGERWLLIAECNACGTKFNLPTLEDAQPYIDYFRREADRRECQDPGTIADGYRKIADRIEAGYRVAQ